MDKIEKVKCPQCSGTGVIITPSKKDSPPDAVWFRGDNLKSHPTDFETVTHICYVCHGKRFIKVRPSE